jgi:hypothetical protein
MYNVDVESIALLIKLISFLPLQKPSVLWMSVAAEAVTFHCQP